MFIDTACRMFTKEDRPIKNLSGMNSILIKLLVTLLCIIAPLYGLAWFLYNWGESNIQSKIVSATQSQVYYDITSLEREINHIKQIEREYVNNDDLTKLSVAAGDIGDYEKTVAIKRIWYQLNLLKNSSNFIESASVMIPLLHKKISDIELSDELSEVEYENVSRHFLQSKGVSLVEIDKRYYLIESYAGSLGLDQNPLYLLVLKLSSERLGDYLKQVRGEKPGGSAILYGQTIMVEESDASSVNVIHPGVLRDISGTNSGVFTRGDYLFVYERSSELEFTWLVAISKDFLFENLNQFSKYFWVFFAASLLVITFCSFWVYDLIHRPLRKLVHAFKQVVSGNFSVRLSHYGRDEFQYLYTHFNFMSEKLGKLITEVYEQKILMQRSELKQLQSQINPHFLYNSFYLLHRLSKMDDIEGIQNLTGHLGNYFQFITRNERDEVMLEEEVNHAMAYVEIMKSRFYNRFTMTVDPLPPHYRDRLVPRLLLQPLLENAFSHGIENLSANGWVRVRMEETENGLQISVEDNGGGISEARWVSLTRSFQSREAEEEKYEVTALVNIHRRLRLKFGASAGLRLERIQTGGLKATVMIPSA